MNTNLRQTKQTLSFQLFDFHLLSQSTNSQICNEEKKKKKKTPILIPKSYFIYFKTPFYNLSNILFIIFHITLNTIHILFISLSFLLSLSLHSNVSFFTHISNPIAKKKKNSSHHTHQESIITTITSQRYSQSSLQKEKKIQKI